MCRERQEERICHQFLSLQAVVFEQPRLQKQLRWLVRDFAVFDFIVAGSVILLLGFRNGDCADPSVSIAAARRVRQEGGTSHGEAALVAVGKARRWLDDILMAVDLDNIAKQEGKGARHIRMLLSLAFVPPKELVVGHTIRASVSELAKAVPLIWLNEPGL